MLEFFEGERIVSYFSVSNLHFRVSPSLETDLCFYSALAVFSTLEIELLHFTFVLLKNILVATKIMYKDNFQYTGIYYSCNVLKYTICKPFRPFIEISFSVLLDYLFQFSIGLIVDVGITTTKTSASSMV